MTETERLSKHILDLQKDKGELIDKTRELERKIASIRGSHRVDLAKLNARIEQVERLKKENAELKEKYVKNITDCDICDSYCNSQFTKAKEIIREYINILKGDTKNWKKTQEKAEQFLKDCEVEK